MSIAFSADSTCDLPQAWREKYHIAISPLSILLSGRSLMDGLEIQPAEVIEAVSQGHSVTTSAVNVTEYEQLFRALLTEKDEVIHFSLGSGFSASHANARAAARRMPQVHVVDTRNLHTGSSIPLLMACEMAEKGADSREILECVENAIPRVRAGFLTTDVEYLRRGGRCSGTQAFGAKVMGIRPSIILRDGRMEMGRKYRGSIEHALKHYLQDRFLDPGADMSRAFISHTLCDDSVLEAFRDMVQAYSPFREHIWAEAGCVITAHCGPGTFAVFYLGAQEMPPTSGS